MASERLPRKLIYGDGVNVAARLESLAEPGGIWVSESVHSAVGNKLPIDYEFMGEQSVKNIDKPVRAYHARLRSGAKPPTLVRDSAQSKRQRHPRSVAATLLVLALIGGLIAWVALWKPFEATMHGQPENLALPEQPSIAVLPFANLSGDPEQDYFADGITEDVITNLSHFEELFVISRTSSFAYKGKNIKSQQIGRELGVRYLLEGSIQRHEDQLRVTAQLIEARSGKHLWASRYERQVEDVFAIQDEITGAIASTLGETLWQARASEVARKPTSSFEAYDYRLRATDYLHRFTKEDNKIARWYYEKALSLDPEFTIAYVGLGWTYLLDCLAQWVEVGPEVLEKALEHAQRAAELDPSSAEAYRLVGRIYQFKGRHEEALRFLNRIDSPTMWDHRLLAATYAEIGESEKAREHVAAILDINPDSTLTSTEPALAFKHRADVDRFLASLRKAGMPE